MESVCTIGSFAATFWGWPLVSLIIFFTLIKLYRTNFSNLFDRIRSGSGFGITVELEGRKEAQLSVAGEEDTVGPEVSEIEKYIKDNPSLVLKEYLQLRNTAHFERCFNLIFGTQIRLIEDLESRGSAGASYVDLFKYYSVFSEAIGGTKTQYADYIGFLINYCAFVAYERKSDSDITVRITPYGEDFLSYLRIQYKDSYLSKGL
ncbi:MAG: hypothetical protein COV44_07570 [Deltaproteobacteria bacterium CG11_big_fil_rev_8_21_14_0_20_45_16]|nr:MAG: hypothetical protein COV44_07570 [Deltaproteobacteria bacterium CG11_big_fil_rev_8_21_14_0_20_45_16]